MARSVTLHQRPNTLAQTLLSISLFACKLGGGPYIPITAFLRQNRSAQLPGSRSATKTGYGPPVQGLLEQAAVASARPVTNLLQCPLKQRMPLL
jgi:hypothetical protein